MEAILGSTAELFHGVCAPPKSFNNEEASASASASCFKRSHLSLSPLRTPNIRWKSITKTTRSSKTSCSSQALIDSDAESELNRRIEKMMAPGTGGLSGLFPLGDSYLVASTDSVGTKVELSSETQIHDTIGIDLVATCVNDIVSFGAEPLYFRDYHLMCSYRPMIRVKIERSISVGCSQSNCAIFGRKIEKMPGCHVEAEYCLGGFAVGKVKKDSLIDGKNIIAGDVLVGLPSNGIHCNGFSLVRRVLAQSGLSFKDQIPGGSGKPITLGEALMAPTVNYVQQVLHIIGEGEVKGIAHITSSGLTASIPRVFPRGLGAAIYQDSWEVPAVFKWIQEAGRIDDVEMRSTFNMGIGMVLVVSPDASARILGEPHEGYLAYCIGEVTGKEGVAYQ